MSASGTTPVKSILKKGKQKELISQKPPASDDSAGAGIQWDEMNIMMTEHPPDKDYGHMKIDEPKTPYHEMSRDDDDEPGGNGGTTFSPDELAMKVEEASKSMWDEDHQRELQEDNDDEDESQLTDEEKQHKKKFREWRKNHYDEFRVFQRAKELLQQEEEEDEENDSMQ